MKLTKYQKESIVRAIKNDIPTPDKKKRRDAAQAAVVKIMSPECRKIFNRMPTALASMHVGDTLYDGCSWGTREVVVGDADRDKIKAILKPYEDEDKKRYETINSLSAAILSCGTLAALMKTFPEFEKYYPTEEQPTKNLPALANVVADLTKLGWPKGKQVAK